jgi:hypothetical protein
VVLIPSTAPAAVFAQERSDAAAAAAAAVAAAAAAAAAVAGGPARSFFGAGAGGDGQSALEHDIAALSLDELAAAVGVSGSELKITRVRADAIAAELQKAVRDAKAIAAAAGAAAAADVEAFVSEAVKSRLAPTAAPGIGADTAQPPVVRSDTLGVRLPLTPLRSPHNTSGSGSCSGGGGNSGSGSGLSSAGAGSAFAGVSVDDVDATAAIMAAAAAGDMAPLIALRDSEYYPRPLPWRPLCACGCLSARLDDSAGAGADAMKDEGSIRLTPACGGCTSVCGEPPLSAHEPSVDGVTRDLVLYRVSAAAQRALPTVIRVAPPPPPAAAARPVPGAASGATSGAGSGAGALRAFCSKNVLNYPATAAGVARALRAFSPSELGAAHPAARDEALARCLPVAAAGSTLASAAVAAAAAIVPASTGGATSAAVSGVVESVRRWVHTHVARRLTLSASGTASPSAALPLAIRSLADPLAAGATPAASPGAAQMWLPPLRVPGYCPVPPVTLAAELAAAAAAAPGAGGAAAAGGAATLEAVAFALVRLDYEKHVYALQRAAWMRTARGRADGAAGVEIPGFCPSRPKRPLEGFKDGEEEAAAQVKPEQPRDE